MRDLELSELMRWGREHGAEIEETEDDRGREVVRVIFDRHPPKLHLTKGMVELPKTYIETNQYCDPLSINGLETEVEEWDDPGQENYSKETTTDTGTVGGEVHVNVWDGRLRIHEVGDGGYNRVLEVQAP